MFRSSFQFLCLEALKLVRVLFHVGVFSRIYKIDLCFLIEMSCQRLLCAALFDVWLFRSHYLISYFLFSYNIFLGLSLFFFLVVLLVLVVRISHSPLKYFILN